MNKAMKTKLTNTVRKRKERIAMKVKQRQKSMEFSRPEYWSGQLFHSPGDLPNAGIESRSLTLQEHSLPPEPPGKPKNNGVGTLSILQQIIPTQESNQDLLHCKWIPYQLSYQESIAQHQRALSSSFILLAQTCFCHSGSFVFPYKFLLLLF